MPFCSRCGREMPANATTCPNCGAAAGQGAMPGEYSVDRSMMLSTTHDVPGRKISRALGIVFGSTVRTRGMGGRFLAGIEGIVGGKAESYIVEMDKARNEALFNMTERARALGADAIIGIDLDISEVLEGYIMVTATGTAVKIE